MSTMLSGVSILVVDDEEDLRHALANNLKLHGASVKTASGAHEALKIIDSDSFDAIISDVRMPDGDGVFLLKTVREKFPQSPPFLFITGFTDHSAEQLLQMGASATIAKPFKSKEIVETI